MKWSPSLPGRPQLQIARSAQHPFFQNITTIKVSKHLSKTKQNKNGEYNKWVALLFLALRHIPANQSFEFCVAPIEIWCAKKKYFLTFFFSHLDVLSLSTCYFGKSWGWVLSLGITVYIITFVTKLFLLYRFTWVEESWSLKTSLKN